MVKTDKNSPFQDRSRRGRGHGRSGRSWGLHLGLTLGLNLSLMMGLVAQAPSAPAAQSQVEADLLPLLREIIAEAYPELTGIALTTGTFSESDSFFQSNFDLLSLFSGQPIYRIEINPRLWQNALPRPALKAVLAHELAHTLDYHQGKIPGILWVLNQLRLYPSLCRYEHRTDLQAIFRGYGAGLKQYREWLYPLLTPDELARKQEVYYTPAEILALMRALKSSEEAGNQALLKQYWLEKPPLNLTAIQQGLWGAY